MLDTYATRLVARLAPGWADPSRLHLAALRAAEEGRRAECEELFALAAEGYRRVLAVEPLARLRVHEAMHRARVAEDRGGEGEALMAIVRGVSRLDSLERLHAPYERADARTVLAEWLGETPGIERAA